MTEHQSAGNTPQHKTGTKRTATTNHKKRGTTATPSGKAGGTSAKKSVPSATDKKSGTGARKQAPKQTTQTSKQHKPAAPPTPKKPKKVRPVWVRVLGRIGSIFATTMLSFLLIFIITGVIVTTALTLYVLNFLDDTGEVSISELEMSYSTFIYATDVNGELVELHQVDNEIKRLPIEIEDIPQNVLDAFVYAEDERFYTHDGVDYKRTVAAFANMFLHFWATDQGGSTITQQLVKNITGDDDKSAERKIREIFRAMQIEKSYNKNEILEGYLNYIGFGGSANGIQMAALKYFGKDAADLSIAEAACLAAIPKSPETMNPFAYYIDDETGEKVNYGRAKNRTRQEYVLSQMYANGAITYDEYQQALSEELLFTDTDEYAALHPDADNLDDVIEEQTATSWVVDAAIYEYADVLVEELGITRQEAISRINKGGYQIYTSVNLEMQEFVEAKYADLSNLLSGMSTVSATTHYRDLDGDGVCSEEEAQPLQSAFCAIDYSGNILAIVGSIGEKTVSLSLNRAQEPQQPGSTMKPVSSYGVALSTDYIHWGTMLQDVSPLTNDGKPWPRNYGGSVSGQTITIMKALQNSYNTIPAYLCRELGTETVFSFAKDTLGLELSDMDNAYSPLAVGALTYGVSIENLCNAYMVYGNGGMYSQAHIISRVESGDGTLIYAGGSDYKQVIDAETATVMNHLLQNVINNGTGSKAKLQLSDGSYVPLAGKTGTTQDWYDLTFVGLTPDFVSGMWIGYDENYTIQSHGSLNSSRIWRNIIGEYITTHYTGNTFTDCETVIAAPMCTSTGCIATSSCSKGATGYWKSTNAPYCTGHTAAAATPTDTTATEE